jgi:hypothetical protein
MRGVIDNSTSPGPGKRTAVIVVVVRRCVAPRRTGRGLRRLSRSRDTPCPWTVRAETPSRARRLMKTEGGLPVTLRIRLRRFVRCVAKSQAAEDHRGSVWTIVREVTPAPSSFAGRVNVLGVLTWVIAVASVVLGSLPWYAISELIRITSVICFSDRYTATAS